MHVDDEHWAKLLAVLDAFDDEHGCCEGDDARPIHERVSARLAEAAKVDKADFFEGEYVALRRLLGEAEGILRGASMEMFTDWERAEAGRLWRAIEASAHKPQDNDEPLMAGALHRSGWTVTPPGGTSDAA